MLLGRRLIYLYLIGTVLAFLWIFINFSTWCVQDDELELERKRFQIAEHRAETFRKEINVLKRHIDELKEEIKNTEHHKPKEQPVANTPKIYIITPTHTRPEQKAELTRLSYTFRLVQNIHWIVVEDATKKTQLVTRFLTNCNLPYTHLNSRTPDEAKLKENDPNWLKPRGVLQRNAGIDWVRAQKTESAVVYFADDDNTYDLQLFEEMRYTQRVSVWPVGLVGYLWYESPVVNNGKVIGWHTYWKPSRQFAMDMAGFAVNLQLLQKYPNAKFRMNAGRGNLESDLLSQLKVTMHELEPRADNCSKVLVWHTRMEKSSLKNEKKMLAERGYASKKDIEV